MWEEQASLINSNTKELKEYRLSYNIDVGDFETRRRNAYDYLVKGHKIKGSIRFRGREMKYVEEGKSVLLRFADALKDVSDVEQNPVLEGRNMSIILTPKKN